MANDRPVLELKPKYVFTVILVRAIFFLFFGAAFLSIAGLGVTSGLTGGSPDQYMPAVLMGINTVWGIIFIIFVGPFTSTLYNGASYRFFSDRLEYDAPGIMGMVSRSVTYDRIVETGRTKSALQMSANIGSIVLKVPAAAGGSQQGTVLLDNLVLVDVPDVDAALEKLRATIKK